ncbi:MAG: hypothetical protein GY696_08215 [Gammaproteobacteria bacterium]|nr:hypothetical protein [Gammaproteobacteria bacterium]
MPDLNEVPCVLIFFTPVKPGVTISTTSSEPATYAILHLGAVYRGGSHTPLGRAESDKPLRLPELSQWPIKHHRGLAFQVACP